MRQAPLAPVARYRFLASLFLISVLTWPPATPIDENLTKGATNNHIFEAGIWGENIDLLNGGLNLTIPLGPTYGVSADVSYQLKLTYSSKIWQMNARNMGEHERSRLYGQGQAGLGFSLHMGRVYEHAAMADCSSQEGMFQDPTGATHPLALSGGVTKDGSYLLYTGTHVWLPTGARYEFGWQVMDLRTEQGLALPSCTPGSNPNNVDAETNDYRGKYVTRIEGKDRRPADGEPYNWARITYYGQDAGDTDANGMRHLIKRITDSSGRTITFNLRKDFNGVPLEKGYVESIDLPAFGGLTARYTFNYQLATIKDPFVFLSGVPGPANYGSVLLLTSITFPQGYTMSFDYLDDAGNNFGMLEGRVLPTGARIEYDHSSYPFQHERCRGQYSSGCFPMPGGGGGQPPISDGCTESIQLLPSLNCFSESLPGTFGVVTKRLISDPSNVMTWRYRRQEYAEAWVNNQLRTLSNPWKVVTTDPYGNDQVTYYHATAFPPDENIPSHSNNERWWKNGMSYLTSYYRGSSEILSNSIKQEWQTWEGEILNPGTASEFYSGNNKRVLESRTVYRDDGGRSTRTVNSDWDGFGNYRTVTELDFTDSPYRIRRKGYNCDSLDPNGRCLMDPLRQQKWVLGTYRFSETLDPNGGTLERSEFDFDALGYLRAQDDLLTLPTTQGFGIVIDNPDTAGDIRTEFCYEGEAACTGNPNTRTGNLGRKTVSENGNTDPNSIVQEEYTYAHGPYLATKEIVGLPWLSENRVIDASTGLASRSKDPNGIPTDFTYDLLGRLTAVLPGAVNGTESQATLAYPDIHTATLTQQQAAGNFIFSSFHFDSMGRLSKVEKRQADGNHAWQTTRYDPGGRMLYQSEWIDDPNIPNGDPNHGTTYDYADPVPNSEGPVQDPLGRVRKVTTADGKVTRTDYAGLSSSVTVEGMHGILGPINARTYFGRDAFGRLTEVISPRPAGLTEADPGVGADAYYTYDRLDRLITVRLEGQDPSGIGTSQYRSVSYDGLGRQSSATNPENGTVLNTRYDARGNLLEKVDAKGNTFSYEYDKASRLTAVRLTAPIFRLLLEQIYDEQGGTFGHGVGKLTTISSYDDQGAMLLRETREYNGLNGRMSGRRWRVKGWDPSISSTLSQPELVMSYSYNGLGLLSAMTYPERAGLGRTVARPQFTYGNGLLKTVSDPARGSLVLDIDYNAAGGMSRILTRGNVETVIPPDSRNRPRYITVTGPPTSGGSGGGGGPILEHAWLASPGRMIGQSNPPSVLFASGNYTYDGAGNISAIGTDDYWYDALNRLVKAEITHTTASNQAFENLEWNYDGFGNMVTQARTTNDGLPSEVTAIHRFGIATSRNQIERYWVERFGQPSDPNVGFEYDVLGNLIRDDRYDHIFDYRNRLVETYTHAPGNQPDTLGQLVARYTYDQDGYRLSKHDASTGTTTFYFRDLNGQVLSEFRRPNRPGVLPAWSKDYVYAAGRHVAAIDNEVPVAPGGLNVSTSDAGQPAFVSLTWAANPDLDLLKYRVHRSVGGGPPVHLDLLDLGPYPEWYDQPPDVQEGQTYTYTITAVDLAGSESADSEAVVVKPGDATPPPIPNLTEANGGDRIVTLKWTSPGASDLWGYYVWRKDLPSTTWAQIGGLIRQTNTTDFSVINDTTYHYRIVAVDTAGNPSLPSNILVAVTGDTVPPEAPQGPYALLLGTNQVQVAWRPASAPDLVGYRVYRGTAPIDPQAPGSSIAQPSGTSWTDTALGPAMHLYYRVSSVDDDGNESTLSEELMVARDPGLPAPSLQAVFWTDCDNSGVGCYLAGPGCCKLPQNFITLCGRDDEDDPPCTVANHENALGVETTWTGTEALLAGLRLYKRRGPGLPYELSRELPPKSPSPTYPFYGIAIASAPNDFDYLDFAHDPAEACAPLSYRVSAVTTSGAESGLSAEILTLPSVPVPENLSIPSESNGWPIVEKCNDPIDRGLTLTWTQGHSSCGLTNVGYHVYRDRWPNMSETPQKPQIKLTSQGPVATPHYRVDYRLKYNESQPYPAIGHGPFRGPFGSYSPSLETRIGYAVTAVDIYGNESAFSNAVNAHTDAEHETDDCESCSFPTNTEFYTSADFEVPDLNTVEVPGAPAVFNWWWTYGARGYPSQWIDSPPSSPNPQPLGVDVWGAANRNLGLVVWSIPSGAPNEFVIRQQRGADPNYYDVALDWIPGDDQGVRQFLWELPLDLVCQTASYSVQAMDLFKRRGPASAPVTIGPALRIPENPRMTVSGTHLMRWDPVAPCANNPSHAVTGYTVFRSPAPMSNCPLQAVGNVSGWVQVASTTDPGATSLQGAWHPQGAPPTNFYGYAVKAHWGPASCTGAPNSPGCSGLSGAVCASATKVQVPVPQNIQASWDNYPGILIEWSPIPGSGLVRYNLYRSTASVSSCTGTMPTSLSSYTKVDSTLDPSQNSLTYHVDPFTYNRYWYRATAELEGGVESDLSSGRCVAMTGEIVHQESPGGGDSEEAWRIANMSSESADGSPTPHEAYEASPHRIVAQSGGVNPAVKLTFYHLDHLGTPRVITDVAGQPISKHKYLPFGEEILAPPTTNTHKFTGHERDKETGLDYMMARYYGHGSTLRFLTADPLNPYETAKTQEERARFLSKPQRWNRYSYVSNSPLNLIDPLGLVEGSPSNLKKREEIDETARGHDGSKEWAKGAKKDDFPAGSNKCNKFVNDVTKESGAEAKVTVQGTKRGPLAAEWADPKTTIPDWRPLSAGEAPQPGDVGAYKLPGGGAAYSGHSGVMVSDGKGGVTSISAHSSQVGPVDSKQFAAARTDVTVVYRRFTGD